MKGFSSMTECEVGSWVAAMKSGKYTWTDVAYIAFTEHETGYRLEHCPLGVLVRMALTARVALQAHDSEIERVLSQRISVRLQSLVSCISNNSNETYQAVIADIEGAMEDYITV